MNEEINEFAESSEMNHQAATESHEECRESMEESHSIVALPCEICDELCPSDKLMEHQLECRKERESARRDDPRTTHHTSPGQQEFSVHVFNRRHESSPIHRTSYIEVQRGYSPTIEFEDDCITNESVEDDIVSDFVVRGERITIDFPPRRGEPFAAPASSINGSGVSSAGFIEIQRSYSPTMEFVEEGNTAETFSHNIPEFVISHTRDSTRSFESRYSPRFNQTENRFEH